jgi:hypothetical protein
MSTGDDIYRRVQAWARSEAAKTGRPTPTAEYLTRHMLESFLDRLTRTRHARDFVLKGGILLASYGVRRPTKDLDAEAISADITAAYLTQVVRDIAGVDADDGVDFDVRTITVQEIREQAEYPGPSRPALLDTGPSHSRSGRPGVAKRALKTSRRQA